MRKAIMLLVLSAVVSAVCLIVIAANDGVELPVIMYHSVLKDGDRIGKYVVSPSQLEEDLKYLAGNGYETVTVNDLVAYVYEEKPLPDKPVMITFDDGYYNNYVYAEPVLKKYGMKAVISVVGKYADEYSENGIKNPAYSYISREDLEKISSSGVFEVQNHSYDMHVIDRINNGSSIMKGESQADYCSRFCEDALKMQKLLENAGIKASCYTYPYGFYCKESEESIRKLGFKASLSCVEGMNNITKDPDCLYLIKRYNRAGDMRTEDFFKKVLK